MPTFTATLNTGTELAHVGYRFYGADGLALAARQTSGIAQNASLRPVFAITCAVPAGALSMEVDDSSDATNWVPLTLNFARGNPEGEVVVATLPDPAPDGYGGEFTGEISGLTEEQAEQLARIDARTGTLGLATVTVSSPVSADGASLLLIRGDDYLEADGRSLRFTREAWPDLTGATVTFLLGALEITATVEDESTLRVELTATQTETLTAGKDSFQLRAVLATESVATLLLGGQATVKTPLG